MLLTVLTAVHAGTIRASSTHKDADATSTSASRAVDGSFRTRRAEGRVGSTENEWLSHCKARLRKSTTWPSGLES